MESRNVAAARGVIEGFARGEVERPASFFAEDGVLLSPAGGDLHGREAIQRHMRAMHAIFAEWEVQDLEFIDAGDVVVAQMTSSALHVGPYGSAPATGRRITLKFCEVYRFNAVGEIVRDEAYYDRLSLFQQLGLV